MLEKVIETAQEAGRMIMSYYDSPQLEVSRKNGEQHNFLTKADTESDTYIRKILAKEFPKDRILSEETVSDITDFSGRVWMVDPLDGTKDFVNKGSGFSVMIGLCDGGVPILGVVYAPAKRLLYCGQKGAGAYVFRKNKRGMIKVSEVDSLNLARMVTRIKNGEDRPEDAMIESIKVKAKLEESSVGLKLGLIASGKAETHVNTAKTNKWDTCAPQAILEEVGGCITDFSGNSLNYQQPETRWVNSFVASNNKKIHEQVLQQIREYKQNH